MKRRRLQICEIMIIFEQVSFLKRSISRVNSHNRKLFIEKIVLSILSTNVDQCSEKIRTWWQMSTHPDFAGIYVYRPEE